MLHIGIQLVKEQHTQYQLDQNDFNTDYIGWNCYDNGTNNKINGVGDILFDRGNSYGNIV
ncbi:hypothetical protein ACLCDV_10850 [Sphingobacterium sp. Lzh-3]|uniref:hypothetical protein n=1 Tax=Sphingobacterium sp. Lzh-3 TaxID=3382150 RepID=UPI00398D2763